MELLQLVTPWVGIALCAMALLQFCLWSTQSLSLFSQNRKQFELSRELLRKQIINSVATQKTADTPSGLWSGYRPFRVAKLVKETATCTSVYLQPEDGKPIASFRPGQHLTFKFQIPGESKPIVRCYSLSDRPGQDYYRISVKAVPPPRDKPDVAPGRASNFVNNVLMQGDRIEVKAPSGHFVLDEQVETPVVLLAGGVGITPMISIANHLIEKQSSRPVYLFYGIRNGADHAFKLHLTQLAAKQSNFLAINCYSGPEPTDEQGTDYHVKGFASIEVLKHVLPNNQCQFYMCGPPPFMNSLYNGLMEWQVPESRVFFEAFGPASIGKAKKKETSTVAVASNATVNFAGSGTVANWNPECDSILELAEENDIMIDSGCRAGSCGTCATELVKGKVTYPDADNVDCEPGKCLVCIAKPDGPIELDA